MESSLYTEDLEVNHLLFHFINLANENNDCISCILVHLISFMFVAIYLRSTESVLLSQGSSSVRVLQVLAKLCSR